MKEENQSAAAYDLVIFKMTKKQAEIT